MDRIIGILVAVLVIGLLIIVHELGHFLVARWSGVRVLRFSIGFGPRLFAWRRGETEYAISAIPLGGYVKMAGEQHEEASHQPWEYLSKPIGTRARIIVAGPFVNYLTALVTLWVVFLMGYPELLPVVGRIQEGSPAQAAGIQPEDRIHAVGDVEVGTWKAMAERIREAPDQPLAFVLERGGALQRVTITPQAKRSADLFGRPQTVGEIGVVSSGAFTVYRAGPITAIGRTIQQQNQWIGQTVLSMWLLVTGQLDVGESLAGPIGLIYITSETVRLGLTPLLFLASFLSLALAIFNLMPIPILDGGHLLFLAIERLRGRPVSVNVQERFAQVSFVLLVALILVISVNDINRFWLNKP